MSFINQNQQTEKQKLDNSSLRLLNTMKLECKQQFELAWKKRVNGKLENKTISEVQSFFDALGNKAGLAFTLHGKLQELIYLTDNSWITLIPIYNYTVNQDGTVTILEE